MRCPTPASPAGGRGGYEGRKRGFRPTLKLALQHSKKDSRTTPLSHAVGEGLGVRAKNASYLFRWIDGGWIYSGVSANGCTHSPARKRRQPICATPSTGGASMIRQCRWGK
jgi:hypothetical protein